MKNILFLLLIFSSYVAQSQYGYGNRRGQRQSQIPQNTQTRKPSFNVKKYLGFINYDIDKALKKTGVKKSSSVGKKFVSLLKKYNNSTNEMERINSFTIRSMQELVEATQKKIMNGGDPSSLESSRNLLQESFDPIVKTLKEEKEKLTKTLEELLSKKQFKKWQKFDKKSRK